MWETRVQSLGWEDPLEEGMETHSSILVWRIPMNKGAWWATVYGVAKSQTSLSDQAQLNSQLWGFSYKLQLAHFHQSSMSEAPSCLVSELCSFILLKTNEDLPKSFTIHGLYIYIYIKK